MHRIAIVGCGKIADQHVAAIQRIVSCEIVALCDRELLMAKQLGERCGTSKIFADLAVMLAETKPDAVHITTPPQGHYTLAKACLEAGSHVYLEKPFTITAAEARSLVDLADAVGKKITAGHNLQFTIEMVEMRRLVQEGFLGGKAVHLESNFSYSLDDTSYVAPVLGSKNHWVRQLPGQLFHNIISHGVAKLAEFLDDEISEIVARAHQSPRLASLGGAEVLDELRVMIRDRRNTTAYFCFSTGFKPGINELRIHGPDNSLIVDHASGSLIRRRNKSYKSYLVYLLPPLDLAREHFRNARRNFSRLARRQLHQDSGMKQLIQSFYESIGTSSAPPIPYREIVLTARIMDEIFSQVYSQSSDPA